jgi:hypothetical protein
MRTRAKGSIVTDTITIDRMACRKIAARAQEALEAVAAEFGLTVTVGGGSYDPTTNSFRPKVEFAAADAAQREFEQYATLYDLSPDDFGRTFTSQGRTFTVAGVAPRSPKRPILATEGDRALTIQ